MRNGMRALLPIILGVAAALLGTIAWSASAEEVIENFHSDITVARDGTAHVAETIRVRAEGKEIRHGIYRDITTMFTDREGEKRCVAFTLLDVSRDGRPEPHFIEIHDGFVRAYAGAKDVLLDAGNYTYVFTYELGHQVFWLHDKPRILWSVTGYEWSFPILRASASLKLPGDVAPVRWDADTGRPGERGTSFQGTVADGVLTVKATQRLDDGRGLTIAVEAPADLVERPSDIPRCGLTLRWDLKARLAANA